jgi:hypothetical protein
MTAQPIAEKRDPSFTAVLGASILLFVICAAIVKLVSPYPFEQNYSLISAAIRHWDFRAVPSDQPREFWGVSYVSALVTALTGMPDPTSVIVVSFCAYLAALSLSYRLWGGILTAWFLVVNWWWLESTVDGGSEPLFMALLLGAFLAIRKERWLLAAALASGATVVRPVGIFALIAIGAVLLVRKDFKRLALATATGAATGAAYLIPMALIYGNPFASVQSYQAQDWAGSSPVTLPFVAIINGARSTSGAVRLPLQILIGLWVVAVVGGLLRMATSRKFRSYALDHAVEGIFVLLYAAFLLCYNSDVWAWQHFPRFAIPLLPFVLLAFQDKLPNSRRLLCGVALVSVLCVVLPKAGIHRVSEAVHSLIVAK